MTHTDVVEAVAMAYLHRTTPDESVDIRYFYGTTR